jgi:hypothetical protein
MTGAVAIIRLLVEAETVVDPLLNKMIYEKKPKKPAKTNHFKSFLSGIFIFMNNARTIKNRDAKKYLKKPSEKGVKYLNANLVKTKPHDQNMTVINA